MKKNQMTLNQIRSFHPCKEGWEKLLKGLNKTQADGEPIDFVFILQNNGVRDAIWCMKVNWFEHKAEYMEVINKAVDRAKQYTYYAAYYAAADAYYAAYYAADAAEAAYYAAVAAAEAVEAAEAAAEAYDKERQNQYNDLMEMFS